MNWSTSNMPDLTGKVAIVTGATSGLGLETALALGRSGAHVVLTARNAAKGDRAVEHIRSLAPAASTESLVLDLADQGSVRGAAESFLEKHTTLDMLINNAGIMMVPESKTVDGYESQVGTNHLGHFTLTALLYPALEAAAAARVVTVSSNAHRSGDMDFENMMYETGYSPMKAYGRSKLANLIFAYELQRRLTKEQSQVISLGVHPGVAKTDLGREMQEKWYFRAFVPIFGLMMQSAAQGALPSLRAASDPHAQGGEYYGPSKRRDMVGPPIVVDSTELSKDPTVAKRLWAWSEAMTGVDFLHE